MVQLNPVCQCLTPVFIVSLAVSFSCPFESPHFATAGTSTTVGQEKGGKNKVEIAGVEFDEDSAEVDLTSKELNDRDLDRLRTMPLKALYLTSTNITDAGIGKIAQIKSLTRLDLWGTRVTDRAVEQLTQLGDLKDLNLCLCEITDAGVAELCKFKKLEGLVLVGTKVSDAGARRLKEITTLKLLALNLIPVTDATLSELTKLSGLTFLGLTSTQVTEGGVEMFQKALPKCRVHFRDP